jgi:transcriptional regulator with XRE-family HTH domain
VRDDRFADRFAENLTRCRKLSGLSQDELSVRASIHRTEISMLERAIRIPRIDTLVKLAASMEVSPAELLDGLEWMPGDVKRGSFRAEDPATGAARKAEGRGVLRPR